MGEFDLDRDGRLPMGNKEYLCFQTLAGFADTMVNETARLERRAKLAGKGTWRDICMMRKVGRKVTTALFQTLPAKKQPLVFAEMQRMTAEVHIKPPDNLPDPKKDEYTTVPIAALEWLIDQVLQWECLCCDKQGKDQKKCPFRARLEQLYAFELPDIRKGECPFQTIERFTGGETT